MSGAIIEVRLLIGQMKSKLVSCRVALAAHRNFLKMKRLILFRKNDPNREIEAQDKVFGIY